MQVCQRHPVLAFFIIQNSNGAALRKSCHEMNSYRHSRDMKNKKSHVYLAAAIAGITFAIYLPGLQNGFVNWDDPLAYDNPHLHALGLDLFRWAFTDISTVYWMPLVWLSHALDYALWGLNPVGHHLTNNLLHAGNTFIVSYLAIRLLLIAGFTTKPEESILPDERGVLIAGGMTGLLFGLHPLHVESVAWVAERKDLLSGIFLLLSIMAYIRYAAGLSDERPQVKAGAFRLNRQYLLSLFFFIGAVSSKPMAVTLPAILLILDWYPLRRICTPKNIATLLAEKIPFIVGSVMISVVTIIAQRRLGGVVTEVSIPERLLVAARALTVYLWKVVLPVDLVPFYPYPKVIALGMPEYFLPMILVAAMTAACIYTARKQKMWLAAWGYYIISLLPVLGIAMVKTSSPFIADRFTYLPGIAPFLIMGVFVAWGREQVFLSRTWRGVAAAIVIAAVFAMTYATVKQIAVWKDSISLWTKVIDADPSVPAFVYNNRAVAFHERQQIDKAIKDYTQAIALDPGDYAQYSNRGTAHVALKQYALALADYEKVIALQPLNPSPYYNIACLRALENNAVEACRWLEQSLEKGYRDLEHIRKDPDLDSIRTASCYQEIMAGQ
ncbi:MAG: hypothetical protein C0402_14990 [Thermodesulfovibrio sp.]|nr:hypothetical protein [Thermodesulfovibrio sp.]